MTIEQNIILYDQTVQLLRLLTNGGNMADYLAELIQAGAVRRGIHLAPPSVAASAAHKPRQCMNGREGGGQSENA